MKVLRKSESDSWADGILSGIGRYIGIDPTILRAIFLITWLGFDQDWLFLGYIISMFVMPEDK